MSRPKTGYRLANGNAVPGVTTIIGRFRDSGALLHWAHKRGVEFPHEPLYQARDDAGSVGSYVHSLIEAEITATGTRIALPKEFSLSQQKEAEQAFAAFLEWKGHSRLKIIRMETPLVCEHYRFGGTPDAWVEIDGTLAIGDWKSAKSLHYDYAIQLAAYKHLHEDHYPDEPIAAIHIIRFGKRGSDFTHRYFRADHPALQLAWRQFVLLREAYDLDKELKELA